MYSMFIEGFRVTSIISEWCMHDLNSIYVASFVLQQFFVYDCTYSTLYIKKPITTSPGVRIVINCLHVNATLARIRFIEL